MLTSHPVEGARPICQVVGGTDDGAIIYALDSNKGRKGLPNYQFTLEDGEFSLLPNKTCRVLFIAGPQGAGKTVWASKYLKEYMQDFPNAELFLFSTVDNDVSLEGIPFTRMIMNQEMVDKPFEVSEFPDNCVMLFDDTDQVTDPKLEKAVHNLVTRVIQIGRHKNIQIIITSHSMLGNGVKLSKVIMQELNAFTFFPLASSARQLSYALGAHLNVSAPAIKKILETESRWVTLIKQYPPIVLTEDKVIFVNKL
jgi:hypothetical protein